MRTGCYVKLPRDITTKKAVINANDGQCVLRVVTTPAEQNVNRTKSYPHYASVLNLQDIQFQITLKDINKFERLNNMSILFFFIK